MDRVGSKVQAVGRLNVTDITLNVEIYCSCGEGLCGQTEGTVTHNRREPCFIVEPCASCMQKEYERGETAGREAAEEENNG